MIKKVFDLFGLEVRRKQDLRWNCWPLQKSDHIVFFEEDEDFHNNYDIAQQNTQMTESDNPLRRQRHYTLMQLFKNSLLLDGDVVECGAFHGLSAYQISRIIKEKNINKVFHIFDSFEGLSKIEKEDESNQNTISKRELQQQFAYGENLVRNNLKQFHFIRYYKGWIPEKFHMVENNSFSFVHIDVDLYQPIKDSIDFFYSRLVNKGIMVFDDYGYTAQFPGAKQAIDEAIKKYRPSFFISLPSGQAFVVK